jgi:hypothetical protein
MIPIGYMYKKIGPKPDWLNAPAVKYIYSVSNCVSSDFADWINYWKHNGYWFFNSPKIISSLAIEHNIQLTDMALFYYEAFEKQWDDVEGLWVNYEPEQSFTTAVEDPKRKMLLGFDIVSFSCQNSAECSPLSCNHMAETIAVNEYCLLQSFDEAKKVLESGFFNDCEPGPYRIFAVYGVQDA